MDVGIVLWITTAMSLHALGTLPLPGLGFLSPYSALDWWDHMTHALSASLVAGAAYATTRAIEEHTTSISIGPRFRFVYLLLFGMAFGVGWELLEFTIGEGARLFGIPQVLTQYGLAIPSSICSTTRSAGCSLHYSGRPTSTASRHN